jgi:hypothetical protein
MRVGTEHPGLTNNGDIWVKLAGERTRCAGLVALLIALRRIGCLVLFEFLNGPT